MALAARRPADWRTNESAADGATALVGSASFTRLGARRPDRAATAAATGPMLPFAREDEHVEAITSAVLAAVVGHAGVRRDGPPPVRPTFLGALRDFESRLQAATAGRKLFTPPAGWGGAAKAGMLTTTTTRRRTDPPTRSQARPGTRSASILSPPSHPPI